MNTQEKQAFKSEIKQLQEGLIGFLGTLAEDPGAGVKAKEASTTMKGQIKILKDDLKELAMNPTRSKAFEWHPNTKPNRRQRRMATKLIRKGQV